MKSLFPTNLETLQQANVFLPEWLLLDKGTVRDHAVVVENGLFIAAGPRSLILKQYPDRPRVELPGKLLMPGFVDSHHHLTQSYGKSLVFGEPSEIFKRVWVPLESTLNANHLYASSKLAALEALRGGFTTVCDAGTRSSEGLDAIVNATTDAGLRCVLGLICNDKVNDQIVDPIPIQRRAVQHLSQWEHHPLITPSLAISIPEVASDAMLASVYQLCEEAGRVFQTHANEHLVAVERSLNTNRLRPIEHLNNVNALGPATLLAHATLVTPLEIKIMADRGCAVAYNPVASAWKGNAVAPAESMSMQNVRLGLGTDGTRSDAFRLMDYAEAAQRFAFGMAVGDSSCGGGWLWLDMATRGGADAIGLGEEIGDISPGKQADFLLLDIRVPEMTPSWDIPWELVRMAARDQIQAVFVDGKLRLWEGWPIDWDALALMDEINSIAEHAISNANIQKLHAPSALHRTQRQEKSVLTL
ncbi:amidohydrolase family protein [Paenalcaligenes niemegkensis]|uniref:amidohydrolase family protein n=1 Tax=Paenalcaligenes niemegkensis TaxID=2895469 RepID=UPI001EE94A75|nr:amidohydrolase family protein [Paenalcaligenes niemegkensis]MCQ9618011.1 amidohydrolase family protein [Paenalcaligenes niemegkensis]